MILLIIALIASIIYFISIILFLLPYRRVEPKKHLPPVSVIIATRNEESVIEKTLKNLKKLDYPRLEIIVVDSSTDRTTKIARKYADKIIIEKNPSGKANALNLGIRKARWDIVYVIDSDSLPEKNTLKKLVQSLNGYDAVVGLNLPDNRNGLISITARLELAFLDGVDKIINRFLKTTIIPGRNFVVYKKAIKKVGGFKQALTEDVNISWRMYKKDMKIGLADAVCREQVPERLSWFLKQQERWTRGAFHELITSLPHLSILELLVFLPSIIFLVSAPTAMVSAIILYAATGNSYLLFPLLLAVLILLISEIKYLDSSDTLYFPAAALMLGIIQIHAFFISMIKSTLGIRTQWYKTPKKKK